MIDGRAVAVVTGGSRGIGRSIATNLGAAGWHVVVVSRDQAALAETTSLIVGNGGRADIGVADVTSETSIARLTRDLNARGLLPDALVNNSGVAGPSRPLWEVGLEEWNETISTNVTGVFLTTRAFLPAMVERGCGAIVNIGSVTGKNPLVHRSPYATSKAAIIGLTKTLAAEAGPHGIRVNLVSPGAVSGQRLEWVISARAEATRQSAESVRAEMSSSAALRRFTEADEVADAVRFLLSDKASGITGIDLSVAAGFVMN